MRLSPHQRQLQRIRAAEDRRQTRGQLAEVRKASIAIATQAVAFGVIGAAIGFCVLFVYGVQRNALPEFGGDEWLPQFVKLGLFCGVLVALLTMAPLTDVWLHRAFVLERESRSPFWRAAMAFKYHWRYAVRQAALLIGIGLLFIALVLFGTDVPFWKISPTSAVVCALLVGIAGYLLLHHAFRQADPATPTGTWHRGVIHAVLTHLVYLFELLAVLAMLSGHINASTNLELLALAAGTTIVLALLQMIVFLVLQSVDRMAVRLVVAAVIVLAVASLFAADAVRLASLGNLSNAHLVVERPIACRIAKHLDLRDRDAMCNKTTGGGSDDPALLDVDVVLRVGTQYTVAAPGILASRSADACTSVHHAPASASPPRDARRFPCVDIPRDAVKLSLR